jgi:GT2 family glycosyltransferase
MLALYHRCNAVRNIAFEAVHEEKTYCLLHVRGTLYANFGMLKRQTLQQLGYFDERYFINAADPDLSLKCWHAGLRVVPAEGAMIDHDEHDDDRRFEDSALGRQDNELLFSKWDLPDRNELRNDFDAARPCTLRGLRATNRMAA